jgi:hypothetical protein
MTELFMQSAEKTAEVESVIAPLSEQQKQLQDQTGQIDDALRRNRQLSWEDQQSLHNVLQNQDSLLAAIQQLHQDVRKALNDMYQGAVMDTAALNGLHELDTLLAQVLPKQMVQALDSLKAAMASKNPDMQSALQKFKYSQADLQKAIDRAVSLLKRLRQEQEMNAMVRKAEELQQQQEKILKNPNKENPGQLAERQQQVKDALDSLAAQAESLAAGLDEKQAARQLSELAKKMQGDSLSGQAQAAAGDYRQGKMSDAQKKGGDLAQSLKSLSQQLSDVMKQMEQARSSDISAKLMQATDDLLTLAKGQQGIEQRIDSAPDLADLVSEEKRLGDASEVVAETLFALSARNLMIPTTLGEPIIAAMKNVDNAAEALQSNNPGVAKNEAQSMRSNLGQAAASILTTLKDAQSGGGFGGDMANFMQQLSQALSQQMQMGQELGGMMPIPVPGGMSGDMAQKMQDLLARQQALRQALEQMLENSGSREPGMTGSLESAIKEMQDLEHDLANPGPQRPYVERNERIVNKLLDAQRSIRQRDNSDQRQSEVGKATAAPPSPELPQDLGERNRILQEQLMRALKEDFPREYEPYVRAYFESLLKQ